MAGFGGGERTHRRDGAKHSRECGLRAGATAFSESAFGKIPRHRARGGRRFCDADCWTWACLWRFRWRWRSRFADYDEQRARVFVSERSNGRKSEHPVSAGGDEIESRRDWSDGADFFERRWGARAIESGARRVKLFVAVGIAGDVRRWEERKGGARDGGMAEREE